MDTIRAGVSSGREILYKGNTASRSNYSGQSLDFLGGLNGGLLHTKGSRATTDGGREFFNLLRRFRNALRLSSVRTNIELMTASVSNLQVLDASRLNRCVL